MKYKIGDKVRVRKDLKEGDAFDRYVNDDMEKMAGKIVTIEAVNDGYYNIEEGFYAWTDLMLEGLKKLTKEELFNMPLGTIIVTDDEENNVFIKVGENDFCNNDCDHLTHCHINEELTLEKCDSKIIEIKEPTYITIYTAEDEVLELTLEDIAKKYDTYVKNIKIVEK